GGGSSTLPCATTAGMALDCGRNIRACPRRGCTSRDSLQLAAWNVAIRGARVLDSDTWRKLSSCGRWSLASAYPAVRAADLPGLVVCLEARASSTRILCTVSRNGDRAAWFF